jgi:hypothetical protein
MRRTRTGESPTFASGGIPTSMRSPVVTGTVVVKAVPLLSTFPTVGPPALPPEVEEHAAAAATIAAATIGRRTVGAVAIPAATLTL